MNREETLALYEQGVEAWNKWANEMLEERKKLEEAGEWKFKTEAHSLTVPGSEQTQSWLKKVKADFSSKENPHTFKEEINFNEFIFPSNASFSSSTFEKSASFVSAKFLGEVDFNKTIFKNDIDFNTTTFHFLTSFSKSKFNKYSSFVNTTFDGYVNLDFTKFNATTPFWGTTFNKGVIFKSATFNKEVLFTGATFKKEALFEKVKFNDECLFDDASFEEKTSFIGSFFKEYTTFKNAQFEQNADFYAIQSESAFSLKNVKFNNLTPNFIQANFKEAPRLDNIEIGDEVSPGNFLNSITAFIHPDIKARYQALKRLAIQAHDHENEQRFWAGELRSDRSLRNEGGSWNLRPLVSAFWWGNIAYGCVSDYGRSIVRPIGALLILICLMTTLHLTASKTPLTYENTFSAGYISTNKSFLYLGTDPTKRSIIKEKYSALYGANENQTPKIPKTILTAEFIQTLLSAIFIFLALLGIRNNFKMK